MRRGRKSDGVINFFSFAFAWKWRLKLKPWFVIFELFKIGVWVESKFCLSFSFSPLHMNVQRSKLHRTYAHNPEICRVISCYARWLIFHLINSERKLRTFQTLQVLTTSQKGGMTKLKGVTGPVDAYKPAWVTLHQNSCRWLYGVLRQRPNEP